jgi:hypothetical protein
VAVAFAGVSDGSPTRSVTVPAGSDRLLVVWGYGDFATGGFTYNGVALTVGHNTNDYIKLFYMLDPPEGSNALATDGDYTHAVAVHYTGVDSFQVGSADTASAASISRTTSTDGALIVCAIAADPTDFTVLADTNERYDGTGDNNGHWVGDRIAGTAGNYTVGTSNATTPDILAAVFAAAEDATPIDASGSADFPAPTTSGSVVETTISGAADFPAPETAGIAYQPDVSGAVDFPAFEAEGLVLVPGPNVMGRASNVVASTQNSFDVELPEGIVAGELLVVFVATSPANLAAPTAPEDWTRFHQQGNGLARGAFFSKVADGTETVLSLTNSSAQNSRWVSRSWRITNHGHVTAPPQAANAVANNTAPNPPSLTPTWGAAINLWLATYAQQAAGSSVNSGPTNYTNVLGLTPDGVNGPSAGVAERVRFAASEDPLNFQVTVGDSGRAYTVAIAPVIEASGSATFPQLQASGELSVNITGSATFPAPVTSGDLYETIRAEGDVDFSMLEASGSLYCSDITGTASFPLPVTAGDLDSEAFVATFQSRATASVTTRTAKGRILP